MNLINPLDHIRGYSPDTLLHNLQALEARFPVSYALLAETLNHHTFEIHPLEDEGFTLTIQTETGQKNREIALPPLSVFPPPIAARYQAYDPTKHWLVLFGIDTLYLNRLLEFSLSEFSPIILIEPDPVFLLAKMMVYSYESFFSFPQMALFPGNEGVHQFLNQLTEQFEPYFLTCNGVFLIPSPRFQQPGSPLTAFTQAMQSRFAEKLQSIRNITQQFMSHYQQQPVRSTGHVAIVEPNVNCWVALGNGLAQGFRECGFYPTEYPAAFPPSSITSYESLKLLLAIQKTCPDYLVTFSHPSDLFARGIDAIPIPRLIWYVDQPDHLIQQHHGNFDILFPLWKEFEPSLKTRGGTLSEEISACGFFLQANYREELACEVGFVGSIHDHAEFRNQFPPKLNQKIDNFIEEKLREVKTPLEELLLKAEITKEDRREIIALLENRLRRPGMTDPQLLSFFLNMECTRVHRVRLVSSLHEFDLKIFGNTDWQTLLKDTPVEGAYQGRTLSTQECRDFYRSSMISLSPHPLYPHSGPNPRDMDIFMCDGFPLSDMQIHARERITCFFEPETEIALFDTPQNAADQIRYFLQNPEQRQAIAEAGKNRILQDHRVDQRVTQMIDFANKENQ